MMSSTYTTARCYPSSFVCWLASPRIIVRALGQLEPGARPPPVLLLSSSHAVPPLPVVADRRLARFVSCLSPRPSPDSTLPCHITSSHRCVVSRCRVAPPSLGMYGTALPSHTLPCGPPPMKGTARSRWRRCPVRGPRCPSTYMPIPRFPYRLQARVCRDRGGRSG